MKGFTVMTCRQCGAPLDNRSDNEWFCPHCDTSVLIDDASSYYDFSSHHTEHIKYKQCNITYHQEQKNITRQEKLENSPEVNEMFFNAIVFICKFIGWSLLALGALFVWMIACHREVLGDAIYGCSVYVLICIMVLICKEIEHRKLVAAIKRGEYG